MSNLSKIIWFFGALIIAMALFALVHTAKPQTRYGESFYEQIREEQRREQRAAANLYRNLLFEEIDDYTSLPYTLPVIGDYLTTKHQKSFRSCANAFMGQLSSFMDKYPDRLPKRIRLARVHACYQPLGVLAWIDGRNALNICIPYKPFGTYYTPDSDLRNRFWADLLALK